MESRKDPEKRRFLGIFGIIGTAIAIPLRNPSFIALTLITSFPLLVLMTLPILPYNKPTLIQEALFPLNQLTFHPNPLISSAARLLCFAIGVLKAGAFQVAKFLIAVTVTHSASAIYTGGRSEDLTRLLKNSTTKAIRLGPLKTFIEMSLLSDTFHEGMRMWSDPGFTRSIRNKYLQPLHFFLHMAMFAKWVEYNGWFQVGVVVSVLEEPIGFGAFSTSSKISRGNRVRGFVLMLLYWVWRLAVPDFFGIWSFSSRTTRDVVLRGSVWISMVLNWVVCTIYYHDCKNRHRETKVALEEGRGYDLVNADVPLKKITL